jgi:hypothetical protein
MPYIITCLISAYSTRSEVKDVHSPGRFSSLLAAYDLGAPASLLQTIYDKETNELPPADLGQAPTEIVTITENNWTQYVGDPKYVTSSYFVLSAV